MAGKVAYTATRSAWSEVTFLRVILCLLVIPIFYLIFKIAEAKCEVAEFYSDRVVLKSGVFNKSENEVLLVGVSAVYIDKSFKGRVFGYGSVKVDILGRNDLRLEDVANPEGLKNYLQRYVNAGNFRQVLAN